MSRPPSTSQPARPARLELKARALGLTSATGLVVGSIIGTSFTMPAVLAVLAAYDQAENRMHTVKPLMVATVRR
ncbi:hypothetical protein [Amycolatopsis thermoflava]|uniref:hypothetical protein n=1 Tax=Amycolatopsis thermoflava TaxID=84480 RepID=UPI00380E7655